MSSWRNYDYLHSTNNYGKVKKINYGNTMQNVGVSSGTPSSMPKVGPVESLPMVKTANTVPKATGTIGPVQWKAPAVQPTLSKYTPASLPKVGDSFMDKINRGNQVMSNTYINKTGEKIGAPNRLDYMGAASAGKVIGSIGLELGAAKQSWDDWWYKVNTQGMAKALGDYASNLDNPSYSFGNPISKNSFGYKTYAQAVADQQRAKEGLTPKLQNAVDLGVAVGSMAMSLPAAAINPVLPSVVMASNAGGNKIYNLTNQGKTATEAAGRGYLSAGIDFIAKQAGYNDFFNLAKNGTQNELIAAIYNNIDPNVKNAIIFGLKDVGYMYLTPSTLGKITWDAFRSAITGAARTIAEYAADKSANDENAKLTTKDVAINAISDAVFSVLNNGTSYFINNTVSSGGTGQNGALVQNGYNNNAGSLPAVQPPRIQYNNEVTSANKRGSTSLPVNGLQLSKMEATTNPKLSINNNQVNVKNKIPAMSDIRNIQNQSDMVMPKVGDTAPSVWDAKPIAGSDKINRTNEASVINQLRSNISDLSKMESVSVIKGNEFQKGDKTLIEAVKEFFDGIGGKVQRDGFGEVLLTKKGIKSSIGHGIGRAKSAAFKAVPDVIKNGKQIGYQKNWKDRGYDTYVFAAPVNIDNRTAYLATVVKHDSTANRFYLHEIVDDTGNILYLAENKDGLDTFKTTSTINASSGVSSPSINIVPNSVQKVNGTNNYNVTKEGYMPKVGDAMPSVWDAKPMPAAGENTLPYIETTGNKHVNMSDNRIEHNQYSDIKKEAESHGSETPTIFDKPNATFNNIIPNSVPKANNDGNNNTIAMERGNNSASLSGKAYSNKTQQTINKLKHDKKELKYQRQFSEAENDLAARMAVGKAKAETVRRYQGKIDKLNDAVLKKGEKIKQLNYDKKELKYQRRFAEAERVYRSKQSKATTDIMKLAKKLENTKMSREEKAKLNEVLKGLDTFGKTLTSEKAYAGMLARDYIEKMKADYPDYVPSDEIQQLVNRLSLKRLSEIPLEEAQAYLNSLKAIQTEVRNRNKLLAATHYENTKAAADNIITTLNGIKDKKDNIITKIWGVESLSMATVLNKLGDYKGGAFGALKDELMEGQRRKLWYEKTCQEMFNKFINNKLYAKEIERWNGKKALWIDTGLKFSDGTSVEITPLQRIDIYMHSQNKKNKKVLLDGGYVFQRKSNLLRGKEVNRNSEAIRLTEADIADITNGMTEAEREFCNLLKKYYNEKSKSAINEVSIKLLGYEAAEEENYYPMHRDKKSLDNSYSGEAQSSIINPGFLQQRTGNSTVPMSGQNAIEVLLRSITETADYYGFAIPIRDFKSVLNSSGSGIVKLEKVISDKFGSSTMDYIEKWITDINGGKKQKFFLDNIAGKFLKGYAASVLNFNPKVSLEQPSALITSAPVVGYKNILKALKMTPELRDQIVNEIDSRTGYRWDRGVRGNSRAELSELTNLGDFKSIRNGILPKAIKKFSPMQWINQADLLTTDLVGAAAYCKIRDDLKISPNSANFWDVVTKEYNKALENTQAMYTPLQRPGLSRSDSTVTKALNMFATERNKHYNMVYDALGRYKSAKRSGNKKETVKARSNLRTVVSSILISSIWGAILDVAFGILRRRKKYEDSEGNLVFSEIGKDFALSYAGSIAGNIFLGSQVFSWAANVFGDEVLYDVTEPSLEMATDFLSNTADLAKAIKDYANAAIEKRQQGYLPEYMSKEKTELLKAARDTAYTVSNIIGAPFKNAERFILGIVGVFSPETKAEYNSVFHGLDNAFIKNSDFATQGDYIELALKDRISDDISDDVIDNITRLYRESGQNSDVLPRYEAPNSIKKEATQKRKAVDHTLTQSDKQKFSQKYSDILEEELNELINSSFYKGLTTEEQLYAIYYLYSYAEEQSKKAVVKEYAVSDNYNMKNIGISDYRSYIKDKEEKERKKKK